MNHADQHTAWCGRGHRCHLGEHRAHPVTLHAPRAGNAVITRLRTPAGVEYAEVTLSVALPVDEGAARQRLATLVWQLHALLAPPRAVPNRPHRTHK